MEMTLKTINGVGGGWGWEVTLAGGGQISRKLAKVQRYTLLEEGALEMTI